MVSLDHGFKKSTSLVIAIRECGHLPSIFTFAVRT